MALLCRASLCYRLAALACERGTDPMLVGKGPFASVAYNYTKTGGEERVTGVVRQNGRLVPKYTFHSLTVRCSSGWLGLSKTLLGMYCVQ